MKVLVTTTITNTINAFLVPHILKLAEQGHEIHLASALVAPVDDRLNHLPFHEISFARSPFKSENIKAYQTLRKLLLKEDFHLIHTHTPTASCLVRVAARGLKAKVLYTAHGFHFYKGAPLKNWLLYYPVEKVLTFYTDGLVTINQEDFYYAKKMMKKRAGKAYFVPGVGTDFQKKNHEKETTLLKRKLQISDQDQVMLFAAELSERKQQRLLLEVVKELKEVGEKNIKLLLLGSGPKEAEYRQYIQKHHLEENIILPGFIEDVAPYLSLCDLIVSSSKQEGLPVNVMEAQAYGVPGVLTKIRGHVDLIKEKRQGFLVTNKEEMKQGILNILKEKDAYQSFLAPEFTLASALEKTAAIYKDVMEERR